MNVINVSPAPSAVAGIYRPERGRGGRRPCPRRGAPPGSEGGGQRGLSAPTPSRPRTAKAPRAPGGTRLRTLRTVRPRSFAGQYPHSYRAARSLVGVIKSAHSKVKPRPRARFCTAHGSGALRAHVPTANGTISVGICTSAESCIDDRCYHQEQYRPVNIKYISIYRLKSATVSVRG